MEACMSHRAVLTVAIALVLGTAACASSGERTASRGMFIAQDEIAASSAANAYELIQSLRPRWLSHRGPETFGMGGRATIIIYVDGSRLGGLETLNQVSTRDLASAERLNSHDATRRWGMNHPRGAIVLTTK
jgi:hypothetical protein